MRRFLITVGLVLTSAVLHAAVAPATLLILPFENATGRPDLDTLTTGIPDLITAALSDKSEIIQVVERGKLDAIMAEQSLKLENIMAEKTAGRLGQLVQARFVIRGSVLLVSSDYLRIEWSLYDTETTQLLFSTHSSGPPTSLGLVTQNLTAQLISEIRTRPGALPIDSDSSSNLWFLRGITFYHQNQFSKAIPEFMKVLEKHPQHADAKFWLCKSYQGAGMNDHAALEAKEFKALFPNDPRQKEMAAHP